MMEISVFPSCIDEPRPQETVVGINAEETVQQRAGVVAAADTVPRELEDSVSPEAWKSLRTETRKLLVLGALRGVCPVGIDESLWGSLSDEDKSMIESDLFADKMRGEGTKEIRYTSNVLKFFMHLDCDDQL